MVIVAVFVIVHLWNYYNASPWTRDGRVRGDVVQVSSDVSGLVTEVLVHDNQSVKKGQVLFKIDVARQQLDVEQARSDLAKAKAGLAQSQANLIAAKANLAKTQANMALAEKMQRVIQVCSMVQFPSRNKIRSMPHVISHVPRLRR